MLEDKLYSLTDIAKLTKLTDRTIRNYLAKGTLKGRKVGGQWRFTKEDINGLLSNNQFAVEMKDRVETKISKFYNNENEVISNQSICFISNFKLKKEDMRSFFEKVHQINDDAIEEKISFVNDDGSVKMVYIGPLNYCYELMALIKEVSL